MALTEAQLCEVRQGTLSVDTTDLLVIVVSRTPAGFRSESPGPSGVGDVPGVVVNPGDLAFMWKQYQPVSTQPSILPQPSNPHKLPGTRLLSVLVHDLTVHISCMTALL